MIWRVLDEKTGIVLRAKLLLPKSKIVNEGKDKRVEEMGPVK